ncbi:DnaD domain protein [Paenibacillus sp. J5C_2022]|uniref:DnaD domain protein n=1 Tax=Paenibacillus sp. J5C2022 TaxID=2977129 RepID=UPI0021D0A225|nr:DnaD domain protein [Paenibacillus sp. J5C2022]MCU6708310.1 DnaD domain protein [Paenibacillus sp. J5C2022]
MSDELWKAYSHGMAAAMGDGGAYLPSVLLRSYKELGLSDTEVILLLQLMMFREAEHNDFPTPEQLAVRMGASEKNVSAWIGRLMKDGFLTIDEYIDETNGMQAERYNWNGWLLKAAEWSSDRKRQSKRADYKPNASHVKRQLENDLFTVFEQELGRLLSPMECETISSWLDVDGYTEEIIRFALKEAVFAGKLNLRYIDRILFEWSRNRVTNPDEARAHAKQHYGTSKQ